MERCSLSSTGGLWPFSTVSWILKGAAGLPDRPCNSSFSCSSFSVGTAPCIRHSMAMLLLSLSCDRPGYCLLFAYPWYRALPVRVDGRVKRCLVGEAVGAEDREAAPFQQRERRVDDRHRRAEDRQEAAHPTQRHRNAPQVLGHRKAGWLVEEGGGERRGRPLRKRSAGATKRRCPSAAPLHQPEPALADPRTEPRT
eukprot:CAMPEP_0117654084 /NCGR_PEP_ID=MMETSP0804-20121206/3551_1 /TAXON_ID=1074897 /ORGANISM="Tetraselmis astigmatica, Strain CCMP880" /LENGTH=196 /DNA_ID=CAMNT_0005460333 /DNA_START=647 /DNA_END=1235 /DNA_ORIENTATION=+